MLPEKLKDIFSDSEEDYSFDKMDPPKNPAELLGFRQNEKTFF